MQRTSLTKYAWLSIGAAIATIALKGGAWWVTGSVGLLSDAAESIVNLAAAVVALLALSAAAKPANKKYHFGRSKAEYFSAALEGVMIFVAALLIVVFAVDRIINPQPLQALGVGVFISLIAAAVNGGVAWVLISAGKRHNSITLRADGQHLLTDLITSVGVVVGIFLVWLTNWQWLDPVIALLVGVNILWTGWKLLYESAGGLLDESLPPEDNQRLQQILAEHTQGNRINFHAFRTRRAGALKFMEMHMLVPGHWTVQRGHDALEDLIDDIVAEFPELHVSGHLEPIEDPRSYDDQELGQPRAQRDG